MGGEIRVVYKVLSNAASSYSVGRVLTIEPATGGISEQWHYDLPDWKADLVPGDLIQVVAGEGD